VVQAAVYALGATHSKKYKVNISPLQVVTVQLLAATVELTLPGLIFERHRPITVSALGIISLIYLAVFGASLAFLRHYRGNHRSLPDICHLKSSPRRTSMAMHWRTIPHATSKKSPQ